MVFKFATFDLTEDINTTFPDTLPSSPESTTCFSLGDSGNRPITARVTAGVSQIFAAPRLDRADRKKKKSEEPPPCIPLAGKDLQIPELKQLRRFTYRELEIATDKFSEKNIVGSGGFSKVYKGRLPSGYLVTVKRIKQDSNKGVEQFRAEVEVGKMVMHRNVLLLIGFCKVTKSGELLLVYPFMEKGNLHFRLHGHSKSQLPMNWHTRKRVALGVARGLSYLHDHCFLRIIHCDIKLSNILLDENLEPLISDFDVARFMDHQLQFGMDSRSQIMNHPDEHLDDRSEGEVTRTRDTFLYMAPEYAQFAMCSPKTDVYAYGVVLLELISGRGIMELHSLSGSEGISRPSDWVKQLVDNRNLACITDKYMRGNYSMTEVERLVKLSLICTQHHFPAKRPNMSEVVSILEGSGSLDSRWTEFQHNRVKDGSVESPLNPPSCSSSWSPEELSGPR